MDYVRTSVELWYVCYGSNLAFARFRCYIEGGRPPGGGREQPGARDRTLPKRWRRIQLGGSVYFAKRASHWQGGGVAFYDLDLCGVTRGRAWLITGQQLSDVAAQENGRRPGDVEDIDIEAVLDAGSTVLHEGRGWYDRALHLGNLDGYPMFTVTAPWSINDESPVRPSPEYLTMIARGLVESGWFTPEFAGEYLAGLRGCAGSWNPSEIAGLVVPGPVHDQ